MSAGGEGATDHSYYPRVPIGRRPPLRWPEGKPAAFAIVVSAEYYEMQPPADAFIPANLPGGMGRGPYPDFRAYSQRAYGNRVGIFRVMETIERAGLRATVALDAMTAAGFPSVVEAVRAGGHEIAGHGHSVTRVISARMSEDEERAYLRGSLEAVERHTGVRPIGWHGPEYGESARTPRLLAELGVGYVLDWPNDEQPLTMTTAAGPLVSLPMLIDFDDVYAQHHRRLSPERWARMVEEGLEQLVRDGAESGRMLILNLHPWLSGHPFRIAVLERLLATVAARDDLWIATAGEIARWWGEQGAAAQPAVPEVAP